jgi:hypothetical protein
MNNKIISKSVSRPVNVETFKGTNSIYNNQFTSIESKSMDDRRYPFFVSLSFVFSFMFLISGGVWGQTTVSWRNEAANGNWENGSNPCNEIGQVNSQWWYGGWNPNNSRNRPDCFGSHILNFDNNHQLSMSLGSLSFNAHQLIFASGNTNSSYFNLILLTLLEKH